MSTHPSRSLRFGPFRLDAGGRVLFRDDQRVVLTPKAVDLLVALVEAGGQPVGKDELLRRVWPDVVVEEGSLASHVSQLRKALAAGGGDAAWIETLSKRGYRFAGPLGGDAPPVVAPSASSAPTRPEDTSPRDTLPPALTAFVGRGAALADVRAQVGRSRMVTLVGAGGTGKTRLATEAARPLVPLFAGGTWMVELAPLGDATLVANAFVAALGARAEGDTPPLALVEATLRDRHALLIVDNCEHVIDEVARVAQHLLRALPRLHLLATSREPLGVEGETIYRVPSLTLPGVHESPAPPDILASEAGQLFVDRAVAVQPGFALSERNAEAVARVCRRLDGIPLAIELAAARLTALSVGEIAERVDDRFRLLTGGARTALPRHRTLRALVDWSHELLPAHERLVFATLSVFAGGFSLDAAERVCVDDGNDASIVDIVEALVSKSLVSVQVQDGAASRYRLLETIRQYAGERLAASGQAEAVRRRHYDHCLRLAIEGARAIKGPDAVAALDRLDAEHDNLRAALEGAEACEPVCQARLAAALRTFWDTRGHYNEGCARLEQALAVPGLPPELRLELLVGLGVAHHRLAKQQRAEALQLEAIDLARSLGIARLEAEATFWLAGARKPSHPPHEVEALYAQGLALARLAGDLPAQVVALIDLGQLTVEDGKPVHAAALLDDAITLARQAGCVIELATALHHAGRCALDRSDFVTARRLLEDALARHRRVGNTHDAGQTLAALSRLALNEDRLDDAQALSAESLRLFRALHDPKCSASSSLLHAGVLRRRGDGDAALALAEGAADTYRALGYATQLAHALCAVGCIHAAMGRPGDARRALFSGLVAQQRSAQDAHLPTMLAAVAALHPDSPSAAGLIGSVEALLATAEAPLLPVDRAEHEGRVAVVREAQEALAFDRGVAEGRGWSRDDAIERALALGAS